MPATASNRALSVRLGVDGADEFRRQLEQLGTDGQQQLQRISDTDLSALKTQFEQLGQVANSNIQGATVAIGTMNVSINQAQDGLDKAGAAADTFGGRVAEAGRSVKAATAGLDEFLQSAKNINDVLRQSWAIRTVEDGLSDIGQAAAGTAHEVDKVVERAIALRLAFGALRSYGLALPGLQQIIVMGTALTKTVGFVGDAIEANDNYIASHKRLQQVLEQTNSASGLTATKIEQAAIRQEAAGRSTRQTLQTASEAILKYKGTTEENFGAILAASDDLAAKLGKDVPEAAQQLVAWMAQGSAAFADMEANGVRVTYAMEKQAAAFEAAGNKIGAAGVVLDAVKASVGGTSGALDESAQSVHRYEVAWTDLVTGVGQLLGPFVAKLREVWAFITAPMDFPRDIATNFMENVVDHLGTRPLAQQLERDQQLLAKAVAERDRLLEDSSASGLESLALAETNVYLLKQKVEKDRAGLAAIGIDPEQVKADDRQLRATLDGNAKALDEWSKRLQGDLTKAAGGPGLDQQIKAINDEFEKARTELESHRNPDGSNDIKVDVLIEDARKLADTRIKAAKDEAAAQAEANAETDEFADLMERLQEEAGRLEKQKVDKALALFNEQVAAGLTPQEKYARQVAEVTEAIELLRSKGFQPMPAELAAIKTALAEQDPAFKEAQRAAEQYSGEVERTAKQVAGDWSKAIFDGVTGGKSMDILDWFKTLFKRIAIQALQANIILPITTQIVGAMPGLFGIQSAGGTAAAAAGGGGGLTGGAGNLLSLGSKFMPSSWTSSITTAIDGWGASALGIGSASAPGLTAASGGLANAAGVAAVPGGVTNAAVAPGAVTGGLTSYLGPIGGGFAAGYMLGPLLANGNKAVGGLAGAASGAAAGAIIGSIIPGIGTLVGALIGGASGGLGGLIGTQKPTVGPTASADLTVARDGKASVAGNFQTDNEGDIEAAKQLGQAFSTLFTTAAAGGATLVKDFGIGRTEKKGLYVSGSLPYKEFGDDLAGLLRYTLLEQGGLKDAGPAVTKAIKNNTAKDYDEATKNIALGAGIDAGTTALSELDKSLASFTKAGKAATAEALKPMLEELERAKKLDLGSEYVKLATDQLGAYLDQLRNPPDYTQVEQDMASLTGQFQAIREAYKQLNPALVATVDQVEKETRARIKATVQKDADRQLNSALGRDYINQINDLATTRDANARSFAAAGVDAGRATEIFNASLKSLLQGLDATDLDVVAASFTGSIHDLAVSMRDTSAAATAAAAALAAYKADLNSRMYAAVGNDRASGLIALDQQQAAELAQAKAAGYDTTQLQQVQADERASQAFKLAQTDLLAAYDQQTSALQDYITSLSNGAVKIAQSAREFRSAFDSLALNDNSPLSDKERLDEARRQFATDYATYKDAAANDNDRDAAKQDLLSLGPTLVQLARSYFGPTDSTDYAWVRDVFAEFGDASALGVDTADKTLKTANDQLKELQKARAEAASMGQKQYGALTGLKDVMDQSYAVWKAVQAPLMALTGTNDNTPHYSAPAAVQSAWDGLSASQQHGIARAMGWGGAVDQAFNVWLATSSDRATTFGSDVLSIAGGVRYAAPDDIGRAWEALTEAQRLAAVRAAGYDGKVDDGLNAWVALGHQTAFANAVRTAAHAANVPGFATGGSFTVDGPSGIDNVLVAIRATPGEIVDIRRPYQAANDPAPAAARMPVPRADTGLIALVSELRRSREEARQDARVIAGTVIDMVEKQIGALSEEFAELRRRVDKQSQEFRLGLSGPRYATGRT